MTGRGLVPLLVIAACSAPPPPPGKVPARDAQASHEPTSAPSEGQRLLGRMAGTFTVTKTFHPRDGGAPTVTHGTCEQRLVHGGRFLRSDFTFDSDAGPVTGTGVIGYDGQSGRFTSFWYDARSTRTSAPAARHASAQRKEISASARSSRRTNSSVVMMGKRRMTP